MSYEKYKAIVFFCLCGILGIAVISVVCAEFIAKSEGNAGNGTEIDADGGPDVESLGERTVIRIEELARKIESAGNETTECVAELTECLAGFGELQNECDTIAEAGNGIEITVDGIEERILFCLRILGASEEKEEFLEGNSLGVYDSGGH